MTPSRNKTYLILTKLHRPSLPPDLVTRSDLGNFFDPDSRQPLTLVCAPAGFGKSTLVAQWIEETDFPSVWFSLDESDDDLRTFLDYLVAAIRQIFPGSCEETVEILASETLPPVKIIVGRLSNDLDAIGEHFILALDDVHRIKDSAVHEVLDQLLEYPPRGMRLVIITRRNPPLSLQAMRGRNILREVRLQDLQFTKGQTGRFIEAASGKKLRAATIQKVFEETEGWPVALRLLVLAIRHQEDADSFLADFRGGGMRLEEYLLTEILSRQPEEIRDCLLKTAILQRYCAPLCDALCGPTVEPQNSNSQGTLLIEALRESTMPCVPLDEVEEWYRFHHLFQEMLERRLKDVVDPQKIDDLHCQAGKWLDENGLVGDAIHHFLKAGKPQLAARVVARHRQEAVNSEQWHQISGWLDVLPRDIVHSDAGLILLLARLCEKQGRFLTSVESMDRAEELLSDSDHGGPDHGLYQSWLDQQRSIFAYHFLQPHEAIELAKRALENLPQECVSERVYAHMALSVSLQTIGETQKGFEIIFDALEREGKNSPTAHSRLLQTLCWMHWLGGDLHSLEQVGVSLLELGRNIGYRETLDYAQYFIGAARYHLNQLDLAEEAFTPLVSDPFGSIFMTFMSASMGLSLAHEARGRSVQARETVDALVAHMLETNNTSHLNFAQAHQATIAMRQGRIAEAVSWADGFETGQETASYYFCIPDMVVARILVDQGDGSEEKRTDDLLRELNQHFEATHNTRLIIETLALRSLFESQRNNEDLAIEFLSRSVAMAQPCGFIRLFVDLGQKMNRLLNRLQGDGATLKYVGEIKGAFRSDLLEAGPEGVHLAGLAGSDSLETLSKREFEVLGLLAQHLTNKEIAGELFISPETVKRHAQSIYQKLSVGSRRDAVAKASGLGILPQN